jgi:2-keto-4-pentenoate hydratase/2-oxohepta-3-ene-1,7-dioic acid hydratase in catechol pathway
MLPGGICVVIILWQPPASSRRGRLDELKIVAPVPDAGKVICVGVDYRDHLAEMKVRDVADYRRTR